MEISVVIPFYNAYEFFDSAYQSIKEQSYAVKEIIVVNDGNGKKADEFLAQYEDIIVITLNSNQGSAVARNYGIEAANYPWVAFLDADDVWLADKVAMQVEFLEKNPHFDSCHTGVQIFDHSGVIKEFVDKPFELKYTDLMLDTHILPTSWLISKKALLGVSMFDPDFRAKQDHELSLRLALAGVRIGFISQPLIKLRRMQHGNTSSSGRKLFKASLQLLRKHWALYKQHPELRRIFIYTALMTSGGKCPGFEGKLMFFSASILRKLLWSQTLKHIS
ncbi:glycosyltransferase family 2 protein [Thalassotalea crassostreae]|uniref:glycosyltransferase family 2 protein n=1 Tax=Thalassotalea crassostreae TaxID=1763536 RepID=UPI0008399E2D|nr:glycosyltransferase family 2 protein [Thalassotalea crassostreae]